MGKAPVEVSNAHSSSRQTTTGRIVQVASFVIAMVIGALFDKVEEAKRRCEAMTAELYPGYVIRTCYWNYDAD